MRICYATQSSLTPDDVFEGRCCRRGLLIFYYVIFFCREKVSASASRGEQEQCARQTKRAYAPKLGGEVFHFLLNAPAVLPMLPLPLIITPCRDDESPKELPFEKQRKSCSIIFDDYFRKSQEHDIRIQSTF